MTDDAQRTRERDYAEAFVRFPDDSFEDARRRLAFAEGCEHARTEERERWERRIERASQQHAGTHPTWLVARLRSLVLVREADTYEQILLAILEGDDR